MGMSSQVRKIYHQAAAIEVVDGDFALPEGLFPTPIPPLEAVTKMAAELREGVSNEVEANKLGITPHELLLQIAGCYAVVEAAGGIVHNGHGEILLIFRRGWWDLPKGKLDPGESTPQAALREVEEETGIRDITLGHFFGHCYHIYPLKHGAWAFKPSHWYEMRVLGRPELTPQAEEQIECAEWVPIGHLDEYLPKMFPSLADLLTRWRHTRPL